MRLESRHFGPLDVDDGQILYFPGGIPGFPRHRRFVVLERRQERPLRWLQAVDDPDLAFAVADPALLLPDYAPEFNTADLELLQLKDAGEAQLLAILVLDPVPEKITANLRAPVVINPERKLGAQVILGEEWPDKHPLVAAHPVADGF